MSIRRISLAACGLWLLLAPIAQAQNCALKQMASLDMAHLADAGVSVPVVVNGAPQIFVVDSAGIYSTLSEAAVRDLHIDTMPLGHEVYSTKRGTPQEMYDGQGHKFITGAIVESLKIGNNEAKHVHMLVRPDSDKSAIAGTVGPEFLELFDVELDFAGQKVNLFSQDHCEGKVVYWAHDYVEVPFTNTASDKIEFPMTLDGQRLNAVLDTGSPVTMLSGRIASILGIEAGSAATAQFKSLTLNGIAVNNPTIYLSGDATEREFRREHTSKMDSDAIYGLSLDSQPIVLGTDVLRHLHLYIAYKERKIYATAADAHL